MLPAKVVREVALGMACACMFAWVTGLMVRDNAMARLADQVAADARLRQALLASEIARFRLLPLALGDDRNLVAVVAGEPGSVARMNVKLEKLAAELGSPIIYVVRRDGLTLAASNWRNPRSFLGKDYSFRPYFRAALRSGVGEQFALGTVSREPGLYFARRASGGSVVVMKMSFAPVEQQWRQAKGLTFVTNRAGIILATSRPEWRYAATKPLSAIEAARQKASIGVDALLPSPFVDRGVGRVRIFGSGGEYLIVKTPPDALGWQVNLAVPLSGSVDGAVTAARIAAALSVLALFGAIAFARQRQARRRRYTAQLEEAVEERTADLRREIEDRVAAEAQAAELREGLRQANRLAMLGQVTASVAHETAQPVAAIRNYAATSRKFLDVGQEQAVRDNLGAIDRLAARIGAVTAELRGFARKGSREGGAVPVAEVVAGAVLLLKERLSAVCFSVSEVRPEVMVFGGHVRLEQVLVNLLQNALDAVAVRSDPQVSLRIVTGGESVQIIVQDNGPGIDADIESRLFTPFTTSRPSGLGLGLVISKDIMEDFGGNLQMKPVDVGACFVVTLRRV